MSKKLLIIIASVIVLIDQATKFLASHFISSGGVTLIKKVLYFTYVKNYGVAFNMLNNKRFIIILISIILLALIYNYMKNFKNNKRNALAFGFIYGGIIGNFIDRIILGYVRDFIDIKIVNYDYPVFNVADSFIVIGVILVIIAILRKEDTKNEVPSRS